MPVECQQQIILFPDAKTVEPCRLTQPGTVVTQCINQNISYMMNVFGDHSFLIQIPVGYHAGCEQIVGNGIYNGTVHFAWHVHVEGTGACNKMSHFQTAFLGNDGTTHGGCQIIHYQYHLRRMIVQFLFEGKHDGCSNLGIILSADSQICIGFFHTQIEEQRFFQTWIIFRSSINETVRNVLSVRSGVLNRTADRSYLHEVRACSRNDRYFHSSKGLVIFPANVHLSAQMRKGSFQIMEKKHGLTRAL